MELSTYVLNKNSELALGNKQAKFMQKREEAIDAIEAIDQVVGP